jgi:hypothetical protein
MHIASGVGFMGSGRMNILLELFALEAKGAVGKGHFSLVIN